MIRAFSRNSRSAIATAAVAVLLAAGVAHSTASRTMEQPQLLAATLAEQAFPDAEYGVDPMVTGPVSASFEKKQADFGCDSAVWPKIPLDCYPTR